VYYNIIITSLSVAVAFLIGTIELLGLLGQEAHLRGSMWSWLGNFDINKAGFYIVGLFVVVWVAALAAWRFGRIESRWEAAAERSRQRSAIEQALASGLEELEALPDLQAERV
jgi:high-affinity nickel-transport protein